MQTLKVEGHENLVRDTYSKAILNTDRKALEEYRRQREFIRKEIEEKKEMKDRVENLENKVEDKNSNSLDKESLIIQLLKQNQELQHSLIELSKNSLR